MSSRACSASAAARSRFCAASLAISLSRKVRGQVDRTQDERLVLVRVAVAVAVALVVRSRGRARGRSCAQPRGCHCEGVLACVRAYGGPFLKLRVDFKCFFIQAGAFCFVCHVDFNSQRTSMDCCVVCDRNFPSPCCDECSTKKCGPCAFCACSEACKAQMEVIEGLCASSDGCVIEDGQVSKDFTTALADYYKRYSHEFHVCVKRAPILKTDECDAVHAAWCNRDSSCETCTCHFCHSATPTCLFSSRLELCTNCLSTWTFDSHVAACEPCRSAHVRVKDNAHRRRLVGLDRSFGTVFVFST